jgi:proline-rich protein PRCC
MDSLLANYGSDEEDADSPSRSPKPGVVKASAPPAPSWNRQSLFGSLPPPKNSAAESSLWDDEDEPWKPMRKNPDSDAGESLERIVPITSSFTSFSSPRNSAPESSLWDDEDKSLRRPKRNIDREGDSEQTAPTRTSFFNSLPPPKLENADWGEPLKVRPLTPKLELVDDDETEKHIGSLSSSIRTPKLEPVTLPSGFFDDPSPAADRPPSRKQDIPEAKPSSLFARLPPAASSKLSFENLPRPSTSKRQVVEFKPPINYALLETTEEDDLERSRKRSKLSKDSDGAKETKNAGGLMSFLPPPKNNLGAGAALGGGGSHGSRRTVMETASDPYKIANEVNSNSGNITHKVGKVEVNVERPTMGASNSPYEVEPVDQSGEGFYAQPEIGYQDYNPQQLYVDNRHGNHDGYSVGSGYDEQSWQYPEANAHPGAGGQSSQGQGVLAEVMKKERRKGRDEPPPQMIEVKQADLTGGSKVREDQMRSTGIAFGPTYKPAASNKDKPSKLHRRKHQIGALYFDMKQNEMNLLDRRAKGNLTKAETQAKYGW